MYPCHSAVFACNALAEQLVDQKTSLSHLNSTNPFIARNGFALLLILLALTGENLVFVCLGSRTTLDLSSDVSQSEAKNLTFDQSEDGIQVA